MCWCWKRRSSKYQALVEKSEDSTDEWLMVPLNTSRWTDASSSDYAESSSDTEASSDVDKCRICFEEFDEIRECKNPREAFSWPPETFVRLCDCQTSFYHVGCLYEQLLFNTNRPEWPRVCLSCDRPWKFIPKNKFPVQPYLWTLWDGEVFRVRVMDDDGFFTDEVMEGVSIYVGPNKKSTPGGPLIPMADAYTTVEVHLPEPPGSQYRNYFGDGCVGNRVPWSTLYSLFFGA